MTLTSGLSRGSQWLSGQFAPAAARRLPPWVAVALVILLAYSLAQATWLLFAPATNLGDAATIEPTTTAVLPTPDLRAVANLNLFGKADETPSAVADDTPVALPETQLKLTLRGVMAGHSAGSGVAIIGDPSGDDRPYLVGDPLPGGAKLEEVHADRVILSRAGRREMLRLPLDEPSREAPPAAAAPRSPTAPAGSAAEVRARILENPETLWEMVQIQPVTTDGVIRGYTINPRREHQLFRRMGLRPGDLVTGINGVAVTDSAAIAAVLAQIGTAPEITLDVERGGRNDSVVLRFD
ncbi:MAG: type II secretion system protein GspC [Chromatiales bacterium]|jgi:general secretion pathway protein C|nr:type II secretion system protein GspC [Chromatiales bacterium]MDX9766678.1 type II secretion system protein GspC [Ectothiorhodospiraceae bacterium]